MSGHGPLVALVHATPLAIAPAVEALREEITDVRVWNLLDDRLLVDLTEVGGLTDPLRARIERFVAHAMTAGADAVMLTCSAYAPVVDGLRSVWERPVIKPDAAMYRGAAAAGHRDVVVLCSTAAAAEPALQLIATAADEVGADVAAHAVVCTAAATAAETGDRDELVASLADAARPALNRGAQAVLLAQYSLSPAAPDLEDVLGVPCYSGPRSAAHELRCALARSA